jgi:hypothetical protein
MRKLALIAAGFAVATGSAAFAEPADTPAETKKICKKAAPPIGSRLGARKVCATKKEWQAYVEPAKRDTRNQFELIQRRAVLGCPNGG